MPTETPDRLRDQVAEAARPAAQIWPLGTFAYRNPVRGFENLRFEDGIRESAAVLEANGFLASDEYRELLRLGRIAEDLLSDSLSRIGPRIESGPARIGSRDLEPPDVLWIHLVRGLDPVDPTLLDWIAGEEGQRELLDSVRQVTAGLRESESPPDDSSDLPRHRTLSDWLEVLTGAEAVAPVNEEMVKWSAAFLDEGLAGWGMPARSDGFYRSWRDLASRDWSGRFAGIRGFRRRAAGLPDSPEDSVEASMLRLGIPDERRGEYLARMFAQLPGWTGFVRWRSENPEYPAQGEHPIDLVEYAAVRLFYEAEIVQSVAQKELGVEGTLDAIRGAAESTSRSTDMIRWRDVCASRLYLLARHLNVGPSEVAQTSGVDASEISSWIDSFPEDDHGAVWLDAYEASFRRRFVDRLSAHLPGSPAPVERPAAQLIFCIDARSEPFRSHIERIGNYETFGYAGFFGVPISHQAFDSGQRLALCPVLLKPPRAVDEAVRDGEADALRRYAAGSRWRQLLDQLFHDLKQHPGSGFALVDATGFIFTIGLLGRTLFHRTYARILGAIKRWFVKGPGTDVSPEAGGEAAALPVGFSLAEQVGFVEGGLRMIGLTDPMARLVVVCGHGAISENNPYAAAYNCGACGGAHGDPNARVFATMANSPEVRRAAAENGLVIPDDTWFVPAKHDTTTDRVGFYDTIDLPASHVGDLERLRRDLDEAGASQAAERLVKLPGAPRGMSARRARAHAQARSMDWANPRPEWGLSSNAAFIIGRRSMTKGLDLESRVFLHSYDPTTDPDGAILEKIMTAPLVVGEWINMEYYFSSVAPWFHGSGSKVIHNVVAGVGVMLGSQGDLQGGLPVQGLLDGPSRYHDPMRLLAVIEAPRERISNLIRKHEVLQQLFCNQWMNLIAVDPDTNLIHRFHPDWTWEGLLAEQAA